MAIATSIGRVKGTIWYSGASSESADITRELSEAGYKALQNDMYLNTSTSDVYQYIKENEKTEWECVSNIKGNAGDFMISKAYSSVSLMNAGYATDNVKPGGLVIINTENVEDADNAKMFLKGDAAYQYLTDLSGTAGIKGDKGDTGATGAQGQKGDKGNGIRSVVKTNTVGLTDTYTITYTDNTTFQYTVHNGESGVTFTPTLSADGDISWTNNGGLSNPASVNLKGPQGDVGKGLYSVNIEEGDLILYTQDVQGAEFKVTEDGFLSVIFNN